MFKIKLPVAEYDLRQFRLIRNDYSLSQISDISEGFRACGLILDFKNGIGRIENCGNSNRAKLYNDLDRGQLRILCNAVSNLGILPAFKDGF
tara:strand:- start:1095 stop:1370 length:276 start_codon:yes stop_codon:yes gene_type:complete